MLAVDRSINSYVAASRSAERVPGVDPLAADAMSQIEVGRGAKAAGLIDLSVHEIASLEARSSAPDTTGSTFQAALAGYTFFAVLA